MTEPVDLAGASPSADGGASAPPHRAPVRLQRLSDIIWRTAVVVGAVAGALWLLWRLRVVTLPVFVAVLLCTALVRPVVALEARGWRPLLAAWTVFGAFLLAIAATFALILPQTAAELDGFDTALQKASGQVEDWLVNLPFGLSRQDVERFTNDPTGQLADLAQRSSLSWTQGARLVGETLAGAMLALVLTFLFLKDGRRVQQLVEARLPARHAEMIRAVARRAWESIGAFLRGAAILGLLEGVIIGGTMWIVGAPLALPVGVFTFFAAFFPIVGAVVTGILAVLVTLAGQGLGAAIVVGVVAVAVQQLDNDLLAPFIYGRSLQLHPAVVLVALAAGGSLGGIAGAFIAVPLVAAGSGALAEFWQHRDALDPGPGLVDEDGQPLADTGES